MSAVDGVLVVDKPEGPTSHDIVAVARRALGVRAIGHAGTLDPMATGVLVLVIGRATRLAQFMSAHEKTYEATIRLGMATDTWDRTGVLVGEVTADANLPGPAEVEAALQAFLGPQDQTPPRFSAKKIDGVRAHVLARRGRPVTVRTARVVVHELEVVRAGAPLVDIRVRCSAGFYVRALAEDLGRRLGCGGCLERLRRTESGRFSLEDAVPLDWLSAQPARALARLVPLEGLLAEHPAIVLNEEGLRRALHGNDIGPGDVAARHASPVQDAAAATGAVIRLLAPDGTLVGIARPSDRPGVLHPVVVLK
ncbi:MAG TPA: tRNA pseudouridine(55) synthase TruB [Vicinamibacterales bacterium]|jgi:tRNA pseudouridine55 synthase